MTFLLGPTFASTSRRGEIPEDSASGWKPSSTSLAQRFRRAISENNLHLAKRVAAKAIALTRAPVDSETGPPSASVSQGHRHGEDSPYGSLHSPLKAALQLQLLVRAKYLSENTAENDLPVRQRALARQKALASGPFDVRNIDFNASVGSPARKSSLTLAIESGADLSLIQWLLDMGHEAEEPTRDADNNTIITVAALQNRADVIELYCSHPTVQIVDLLDWSNNSLGQTALHLASVKGHEEVIKLLLDLGAEIDLPDREGNTSLHFASAWGHLTVVQLLIERGCSFNMKNSAGFTAADFAFSHSIKAALEGFGRVQHEMRRRRQRAASSTDDSAANSFRRHGAHASPSVVDNSALYDDDDYEEIDGYHVGSSAFNTSFMDMPSKAERLMGTSLPPVHLTSAPSSSTSSTFYGSTGPSPRTGVRSNFGADFSRPQLPLTPNTRHVEPSPPLPPSSEDVTLPGSADIATKVIMKDQAAMNAYLRSNSSSLIGKR